MTTKTHRYTRHTGTLIRSDAGEWVTHDDHLRVRALLSEALEIFGDDKESRTPGTDAYDWARRARELLP